jgi:spore maturation protein CgeB
MSPARLKIVILGLSITSSWGNGHATTFRGLMRELVARGHEVLFLERDQPWYAAHRDLPCPPFGRTELYDSLGDLKRRFIGAIRAADLVLVGSYVPEAVPIARWLTRMARSLLGFYDIDTPVTLGKLERGDYEYLSPDLIPHYHLYLSFTGGPTLARLERQYGSPCARPLYCAVDPALYFPEAREPAWDLGYMGTYTPDRQAGLEQLLLEPARAWPKGRLVVAGALYPADMPWPANVEYIEHVPASRHRAFYNAQRFTLNLTRADMIRAGYSPGVRLFEAAACAMPILSDYWEGLDTIFVPGKEILIAPDSAATLSYLRDMPAAEAQAVGQAARAKVLARHTAAHRAAELERYVLDLLAGRRPAPELGRAARVQAEPARAGVHVSARGAPAGAARGKQ